MPAQQKQKAKGRKIGRNKKHQAQIYESTDRWNKNRKRAMRRHLRSNPGDFSSAAIYEKRYGKIQIKYSNKGRRLMKSKTSAKEVV